MFSFFVERARRSQRSSTRSWPIAVETFIASGEISTVKPNGEQTPRTRLAGGMVRDGHGEKNAKSQLNLASPNAHWLLGPRLEGTSIASADVAGASCPTSRADPTSLGEGHVLVGCAWAESDPTRRSGVTRYAMASSFVVPN
ncbi:hypothetical protein [Labilithrix luteola]|uniref:hypothetical protein n=1 Tax=Labilithrix luteola TaxID=1391654 RepID=UPI0011BA987C|nr:hypothetical protein [Labilithrix luteola]